MARQVRLVVGEGDQRVEVGHADIEKKPNGETMVLLTVTNPSVAALLGGNQIKGIIPAYVDPAPEEEPGE